MPKIPQRVSLHDQLIEILRQGIVGARWGRDLPSERNLCGELQVSRGTLRKALAQLAREGLLGQTESGRRSFLHASVDSSRKPRGMIIRVLIPCITSVQTATVESLGKRLGRAGYRVEFEIHPHVYSRFRPAELQRLNSLPDTAGWVLLYCTEKMQRWFAASGRPCLVIGRTYEDVELSSIFVDVEALARHAADLFQRRGHRDLVYLKAEFTSLTDQLGSEVFVAKARLLGMRARIVTHPVDASGLRRVLDSILASETRPTGFYSGCPEHCLTTLCHMVQAGLRVPEDVAIISGGDDLCLHYAVPTIAHYKIDDAQLVRKAATMLLDLLEHGSAKLHTKRLLPEFVPGGTIEA